MPTLQRTTRRLLSTVNGKPHATQDDHQDVLPTPPATNSARSSASKAKEVEEEPEDIYRSPESSEDEESAPAPATYKPPPGLDGAQDTPPKRAAAFQQAVSYAHSPEKVKPKFQSRRGVQSPESTRSKRSNESEEQKSSDTEEGIFGSQGQLKKQKQKPTTNIHASQSQRRGKKQMGYGKSSQRQQKATEKLFKQPQKDEAPQEPAAPQFKKLEVDMYEFQGSNATFRNSLDANAGADNSDSISLSSLSSAPDSPEVEEIEGLGLPAPIPYCAAETCKICGEQVSKLSKQNFEDEFTNGKAMNFKWQQRFCQHHKQQKARDTRAERGWPEIDWTGLEERMRKFDDHLRDVIHSRVHSQFKHNLSNRMQPSKSKFKDVREAADAKEVKTQQWTGYYGPRGGKIMAEHIIFTLSPDIRSRASKDKVVAAAGVQGGVSGFIQGVLVPELACQLVAEDLQVSDWEAMEVLGRSADVGELLNPDLDDAVTGDDGGGGAEEGEDEEMEDD